MAAQKWPTADSRGKSYKMFLTMTKTVGKLLKFGSISFLY